MNLRTLQWDEGLCEAFGVSTSMLPEIRSSSEVYGKLTTTALKGRLPFLGVHGAFRVWGLGFGVRGLGFGVWGLGFGVEACVQGMGAGRGQGSGFGRRVES